jgi:hypothetical protein
VLNRMRPMERISCTFLVPENMAEGVCATLCLKYGIDGAASICAAGNSIQLFNDVHFRKL